MDKEKVELLDERVLFADIVLLLSVKDEEDTCVESGEVVELKTVLVSFFKANRFIQRT